MVKICKYNTNIRFQFIPFFKRQNLLTIFNKTIIDTLIHSKTEMSLRIIQEYLQPKIGGKIRIFSLARENNILIKKKSV